MLVKCIGILTYLSTNTSQPFVEMIFRYIKAQVIMLVMKRFAPLDKLLVWMAPKSTKDLKLFTHNLIRSNVDKRLASDDSRLDLYVIYIGLQVYF